MQARVAQGCVEEDEEEGSDVGQSIDPVDEKHENERHDGLKAALSTLICSLTYVALLQNRRKLSLSFVFD